MEARHVRASRVAVIGAGISGVVAAIHLKRAGVSTTVYERTSRVGGIWVFNDHVAHNPAYPSVLPSVGDSPEFEAAVAENDCRQDSPMQDDLPGSLLQRRPRDTRDLSSSFAPPGPCYTALKNNVSTVEMELTSQAWKPGTDEFVAHHVLADYIQDTAKANGVLEFISFNTRVSCVVKQGDKWKVQVHKLLDSRIIEQTELYDAVVVASGHYHACNVPEIPGLAEWKRQFPNQVQHSKLYRRPESFRGQNVLLIGAGVSSMDIAKDLGPYARSIYQSSRGGPYDLPSHMLPDNAARVGGVDSFGALDSAVPTADGTIPATVALRTGEKLCDIHRVIVCTGYHVSFPFMRQYHADGISPEHANDEVLVTNGQQTHNLHKDIFYIPDPTLAFIGVPYHVATFSLFEFQAMALASVFSGRAPLPSTADMRAEYKERINRKGAGRTFHSLKGRGDEAAYVVELARMVNEGHGEGTRGMTMPIHKQRWLDAYALRCQRQQAVFSRTRDNALDKRVMSLVVGC